jgi:single-stranded DNA-specific DHH superfamily exonuclease
VSDDTDKAGMTTLDEIRARLAKANRFGPNWTKELHNHAPTDLAFLLGEVERLQKENDSLAAALQDETDQGEAAHERAERAERERDRMERALRKEMRIAELQASIMRDPRRTGGWEGAENVASAFDRTRLRCAEALSPLTPSERESTPRQQDKGEPG